MYMSPEHIRNDKLVDHRTDIWAMGVVLYELLTGQTPFEADGIGETFGAVLNRTPASARVSRPDIPAALDAAILKCLEQDPDDRWPDVAQFSRAIGPYGTGACAFLVESTEQTLRQKLRRYTGKSILLRPTTANAMSVTVEAPTTPAAQIVQNQAAATRFAEMTAVSPMTTPLPFPGLRPRWGRWMTALAIAVIAPITYLRFFASPFSTNGVATASSGTAAPVIASAAASSASSVSSAVSAASRATASATSSTKTKVAAGAPRKSSHPMPKPQPAQKP
jgi:serine/threonine-protein kinase